MDLVKVLEELRREREYLDSAIVSLERLRARASRRGRPPKVLSELRRASMEAEQRAVVVRRAAGGSTEV